MATLPRLVDEVASRWSLTVAEPYAGSLVALAAPATRADGTPAVVKISFPHWESEHEAAALRHWGGDGAVRLLDEWPERRALLLERCLPGTALLDLPEDEGYPIAVSVLRKLNARAAPERTPIRPFAETARRWAIQLPHRWERAGRPFERALLDAALEALEELPPTQGNLVVCSQDFHRGNVLRAQREPWLAIDPKPVLAEREFSAVALLRDGPGRIAWRLDFVASEVGLDRDRTRRWSLAHTIAWSFAEAAPQVSEPMIEIARRLHAA
jgi:streptomycin 6-kinase